MFLQCTSLTYDVSTGAIAYDKEYDSFYEREEIWTDSTTFETA